MGESGKGERILYYGTIAGGSEAIGSLFPFSFTLQGLVGLLCPVCECMSQTANKLGYCDRIESNRGPSRTYLYFFKFHIVGLGRFIVWVLGRPSW